MDSSFILPSIVLFGLTALCYWLPFKSGNKKIGLKVSIILYLLITYTLIDDLGFLVLFVWSIILAFQIVFISYWIFRVYNRKKIGSIVAFVLTISFLSIALSPWITDLTFSKKDVRQILLYHGFELKDEFEIVKNESGGLRDYYQTFTLELSDSDYKQIADKIKTSENFHGLFTDLKEIPHASSRNYDTIDYETNYNFNREYFTKQIMDDGTYHFRFELSKSENKLSYFGSDE